MKRVIRILGLACMAGLFVFTSCKKEKATTTEIEVVIPGMAGADESERAYINDNWKFRWIFGDEIMVYNLDTPEEDGTTASVSARYMTSTLVGGGEAAKFSGPTLGKRLRENYRYFYPVNMVEPTDAAGAANMAALGNENRQTFYVMPEQSYNFFDEPGHPQSRVDVRSMPMAVSTNNLKASATLKHMFGVADIQLVAETGHNVVVNKITIVDNVYHLWGNCSVKLHPVRMETLTDMFDNYFLMYDFTGYAERFASYVIGELGWTAQPGVYPGVPQAANDTVMRTMVLNCRHIEGGVEQGVTLNQLPAEPNEFCIMLRPLALSYGFTIIVEFENREPLTITNWADNTPGKIGSRCMYPGTYRVFRLNDGITAQ